MFYDSWAWPLHLLGWKRWILMWQYSTPSYRTQNWVCLLEKSQKHCQQFIPFREISFQYYREMRRAAKESRGRGRSGKRRRCGWLRTGGCGRSSKREKNFLADEANEVFFRTEWIISAIPEFSAIFFKKLGFLPGYRHILFFSEIFFEARFQKESEKTKIRKKKIPTYRQEKINCRCTRTSETLPEFGEDLHN